MFEDAESDSPIFYDAVKRVMEFKTGSLRLHKAATRIAEGKTDTTRIYKTPHPFEEDETDSEALPVAVRFAEA